jgi:hypothetical protein
MSWLWKRTVIKALCWVVENANIRMYSSHVLVGTPFKRHDIIGITDSFWVLDIRFAGKILLLGSFQTS